MSTTNNKTTSELFGRLKIVKETDRPANRLTPGRYYLCQCTCGQTKTVSWDHLRGGFTKSCGCIKRENNLERAKRRKIVATDTLPTRAMFLLEYARVLAAKFSWMAIKEKREAFFKGVEARLNGGKPAQALGWNFEGTHVRKAWRLCGQIGSPSLSLLRSLA